MNRNSKTPTTADCLPDKSGSRALAETAVMAAIASIPLVGHATHVVLADYLQRQKEERWARFWESVVDRISKLEAGYWTADHLRSQAFMDQLFNVFEQVTSKRDDKKWDYLRTFLIRCASPKGPDVTWRDLFMRHLSALTGAHLICLQKFFSAQLGLSEIERFEQRRDNAPIDLAMLGEKLSQQWDRALLEVIISDLESAGLIRSVYSSGQSRRGGWSITNSGIRFVGFITEDASHD